MATLDFDPQNPMYPQGCYAVPLPDHMVFKDTNTEGKPEINFNKAMYFTVKNERNAREIISNVTIRDIIRSPDSPWEEKLQGMVMLGPNGEFVPAHLPNSVDIVGTIDLVDVFKKLNSGNAKYNKQNLGEVIPKFLEKIVDPTPIINIEGPIYPLTIRKVKSEFACYSDGFQIFYLHEKISELDVIACVGRFRVDPFIRYTDVSLESKYEVGENAFRLGSSIVMWNARGVTRPSFKSNVQKIIAVHKPIIFIIVEARVYRKSFEEIFNSIDYEFNWTLDESVGLMGGLAVIWDEKEVKPDELLVTMTQDFPMRLLGTMKPAPKEDEDGAADEPRAKDEEGATGVDGEGDAAIASDEEGAADEDGA